MPATCPLTSSTRPDARYEELIAFTGGLGRESLDPLLVHRVHWWAARNLFGWACGPHRGGPDLEAAARPTSADAARAIDGRDTLVWVSTTCALCHSTVNNSFAPGIGSRLDGWPNSDLNPGAILALSPALSDAQKAVYNSWGPGRYDPRFNFDGVNGPVVIPPAYGLLGVNSITYTGDGADIAYWNRYVGVTQMHGHGTCTDSRTGVAIQNPPDQISTKLEALQAYQLSLESPAPPAGSFDAAAAQRGRAVFQGVGRCATCHVGTLLTDANTRLHDPAEVVSEPEPNGVQSFASRSATGKYRTTPLRGLLRHPPYFHNGIAATLDAVVELYDTRKGLNLTAQQKADLVEYLKSR